MPKKRENPLRKLALEREAARQARVAAGTERFPDPLPVETIEALRKAPRPR